MCMHILHVQAGCDCHVNCSACSPARAAHGEEAPHKVYRLSRNRQRAPTQLGTGKAGGERTGQVIGHAAASDTRNAMLRAGSIEPADVLMPGSTSCTAMSRHWKSLQAMWRACWHAWGLQPAIWYSLCQNAVMNRTLAKAPIAAVCLAAWLLVCWFLVLMLT
jgi:hypothetical protein